MKNKETKQHLKENLKPDYMSLEEVLDGFFNQLKPSNCKSPEEYDKLKQYRIRYRNKKLGIKAKRKIALDYANVEEKCVYFKK